MAKKSAASATGSVSTPATLALTRAGIPFTVRSYTHDPTETDYGGEAAAALGVDSARIFKTLLAEADGELAVAVVPVSGSLNLKALAAALGAKRAVMADPVVAERKTGYVLGGISPIGQRTRLRTVLDESARDHSVVLVSGGRRGFDIELAPVDLVRVVGGSWARIAKI